MLLRTSTFVIRLVGLVFLLFGAACLMAPTEIIQAATGLSITHSIALTDIRATYGGMSFGVAVILFLLASSTATIRVGLSSVFAIMLGMAGGRLVGIILAPATNWVMLLYLLLEVLTAAVSAILLHKTSRAREL